MLACLPTPSTPLPIVSHLFTLSTQDVVPGYATIDGDYISQEEGEEALRTGMAVLVGGLFVGLGSFA
ncbi:hypothetical protein [Hymenobacter norwichensis]|uniref:hypothetical protein n=1 Tax=Hymenobacter norwichensis TaxID=223903 RepID=UPI0003B59BCC|nr:hypothetical protein [Hymenobacter norwichensis]